MLTRTFLASSLALWCSFAGASDAGCDNTAWDRPAFLSSHAELDAQLQLRGWDAAGDVEAVQSASPLSLLTVNSDAKPGQRSGSDSCLKVPNTVCIGNNGGTVLSTEAQPKGLVGRWSFDDSAASDTSGLGNAMSPVPAAGPGFGGTGASAYFPPSAYGTLKHLPAYDADRQSVTMWVFLLESHTASLTPLYHKSDESEDRRRAVDLLLEPESRALRLRMGAQGSLTSRATLPVGRWTHVAFTRDGRVVSLYVNGRLDSERLLAHAPAASNGPIFVGGTPWLGVAALLVDELRLYDRALSQEELQATAAAAFPGLDAASVRLGCQQCGFKAAQQACSDDLELGPQRFKMCSRNELDTGAMVVARSMGWLRDAVLWIQPTLPEEQLAQLTVTERRKHRVYVREWSDELHSALGTGLCCLADY